MLVTLENIRRIIIFVTRRHADVTYCEKTQCYILKTEHSTELKTGQQIYV